jgi:hypothetical protein
LSWRNLAGARYAYLYGQLLPRARFREAEDEEARNAAIAVLTLVDGFARACEAS